MPKLYIFGIGGTGSRVIKSLTMLLAAGFESKYSIVPIIIDPDKTGGDKSRTEKLLRDYQAIQKEVAGVGVGNFFDTEISTLSQILSRKGVNSNVIDNFSYEIEGVQNEKFRDFIDYATLDANNKLLASLLFSEKNLNASLEVGFKGNPNIGSIVLNQFTKSESFQAFAESFEKGDRIFIISSIFGGTGAAGFPLLLKNIRKGDVNGKHNAFLKDAIIGAITVTPYFKVKQDDDSEIDSHGFITKTKAALHYYAENVNGNNSINAMYYIGGNTENTYENREGGKGQKNDAHFVELASALAILNFVNIDDHSIPTIDGRASNPLYKVFGIKETQPQIGFKQLADYTEAIIKQKLSSYFYFNLFLKEKLKDKLNHPYASAYTNKFDSNFLQQFFFTKVTEFNQAFRIWLGELHRNKISFSPFDIDLVVNNQHEIIDISIPTQSIFTLVRGYPEKKSFNPLTLKNYELFIKHLDKAAEKVGEMPVNKRFIGVFETASNSVLNKKLF
ncbi:hypothetical protein COR50_04135 [Chitinophaga caeni]|uniref:Uncharacterized protein n=1 Tax=Chitinophaga caeni TaxID=2029983 RepID=A0A291QR59_9BACT|nr:hypothetical protein [Chitinophaga caeni]ATL46427.1 hypothetical protein COR50_04135 [Chitinophaga caeni]